MLSVRVGLVIFVPLAAMTFAACADEEEGPAPPLPDVSHSDHVDASGPTTEPSDLDASIPDVDAPTTNCTKHISVISTVGVPGSSKFKTNGCWSVTVTDGASNKSYRKCSTIGLPSAWNVQNAAGTNYAYDDTNTSHPLAQEKSFLAECAAGATGDGWEFMAYRNKAWRALSAPGLKAYFAELYGSALTDIASLYDAPGVYKNNATLAAHANVYPMMNFGPPKASKLEAKVGALALKICATVKDGGYFGAYNASWEEGMAADDPRLLALEKALDTCTTTP